LLSNDNGDSLGETCQHQNQNNIVFYNYWSVVVQ
jgi:hypothetical protein